MGKGTDIGVREGFGWGGGLRLKGKKCPSNGRKMQW